VPGPCLHAGRARAACVSGGSRGNGMGAGGRSTGSTGGRRPLVGSCSQCATHMRSVCEWTPGGLGDTVSFRCAGSGMRGRLGWCSVQWLFQGCCSGDRLRHWTVCRLLLRAERVDYGNVPDNVYSQGRQELHASAGACRAGSLADAQGPTVASPPPRCCLHPWVICFLHCTLPSSIYGRKVPITVLGTIIPFGPILFAFETEGLNSAQKKFVQFYNT